MTHDLIGRLMIQSARHPGLARVWADLLGFEGCEFYCAHHPELVGKTFGEALLRFDDAVPIGVVRRDRHDRKSGHIYVNPDDDLKLDDDMEIIVIAEDDDSYRLPESARIRRVATRMEVAACSQRTPFVIQRRGKSSKTGLVR